MEFTVNTTERTYVYLSSVKSIVFYDKQHEASQIWINNEAIREVLDKKDTV